MWSVVTESPSFASTRAPRMSVTAAGVIVMPSKYGGLRTYVELSSHSKIAPVGAGRFRHRSSPSNTLAYCFGNIRSHRHAVEVRRLAHIRRAVVPLKNRTGRGGKIPPPLVTLEHARVLLRKHRLING